MENDRRGDNIKPLRRIKLLNRKARIGDLVAQADHLPASRVLPLMADNMRDLLSESLETPLSPAQLRRLVIMGALINRLLFSLTRIPRDPQHLI